MAVLAKANIREDLVAQRTSDGLPYAARPDCLAVVASAFLCNPLYVS